MCIRHFKATAPFLRDGQTGNNGSLYLNLGFQAPAVPAHQFSRALGLRTTKSAGRFSFYCILRTRKPFSKSRQINMPNSNLDYLLENFNYSVARAAEQTDDPRMLRHLGAVKNAAKQLADACRPMQPSLLTPPIKIASGSARPIPTGTKG